MIDPDLKGKRAIAWLRCSTDQQTETSIPDQERLVVRFLQEQGMLVVDTVRLEGMSASVERNLDVVIAELILRKRTKNDFDVIALQDLSRFSRTGPRHAAKLLFDLEKEGIRVVSVFGYLPRGDSNDILETVNFVASHQQAKGLAAAVARGTQSSLEQGRRAYCYVPPYGIDKLILSADGRPLHVIRMLPNRIQVRLHADTGEEIERSSFDSEGRVVGRYQKSREQRVELVPGAPGTCETVRLIFELFYLKGWGVFRIAKCLNDRGVPSPRGGTWGLQSVRIIVRNPVYTGEGIANRSTAALYYQCSPTMPKSAVARPTKARHTQHLRPRDEWMRIQLPRLRDYLPARVREIAQAQQAKYLGKYAEGRPIGPPKTRHADSEFLLTGLLRSKSGSHPFSGRRAGRGHGRYYQVARGNAHPSSGSSLGRMIPAEPIERCVVTAVQDTLVRLPSLSDQVIDQTRSWLASRNGAVERQALEKELGLVTRRIEFVDSEIDRIGIESARAKLAKLAATRKQLESALSQQVEWEHIDDSEVVQVVEKLVTGLGYLGADLADLPRSDIKRLLRILVESAEVDVETREATVTVRVPSWAGISDVAGSLGSTPDRQSALQASQPFFRQIVVCRLPPPKSRLGAGTARPGKPSGKRRKG